MRKQRFGIADGIIKGVTRLLRSSGDQGNSYL